MNMPQDQRNSHDDGKAETSGTAGANIPEIIAQNIVQLRKSCGMTQAGLAEKIGYSDKSVSKWERADGIPDVICLKAIADLFGVTVDYMLTPTHDEQEIRTGEIPQASANESLPRDQAEPDTAAYSINHIAVTLLSVAGVWLLSFLVFIIGKLAGHILTMSFVVACPVSAILLVVFNSLWGEKRWLFWIVTFLTWSILFLICYAARSHGIWLLMLTGFPATLVIWLATKVKVKKE